jgi:hypothetical protein
MHTSSQDKWAPDKSPVSRLIIRVSNEINFVGISIGILIEINFDFWRNYWLKLSKAIGISISPAEIEIQISNQNRIFDLFRWKMLWNFDICMEILYCNRNSDVGIEITIRKLKSKSEFRCRNQNRNSDFGIETEISISSKVKKRLSLKPYLLY